MVDAFAQHHHHSCLRRPRTTGRSSACSWPGATTPGTPSSTSTSTRRTRPPGGTIALPQAALLPIHPAQRRSDLRPPSQPRPASTPCSRSGSSRSSATWARSSSRSRAPSTRARPPAPPEPVLALRPGLRVADGDRGPAPRHGLGRSRRRPHDHPERSGPLPDDRDAVRARRSSGRGRVARAFEMTTGGSVRPAPVSPPRATRRSATRRCATSCGWTARSRFVRAAGTPSTRRIDTDALLKQALATAPPLQTVFPRGFPRRPAPDGGAAHLRAERPRT